MNSLYQGNSDHQNSLEVGHEFQDFITEKLAKEFGIAITIFQSKKYQFQRGESLQGVEIKYDARSTGDCTYKQYAATGNVAIEIAEKSHAGIKEFSPSGIYRRDNSWIYVVGNFDCAWIFMKKHLILMHKSGKYKTLTTRPTLQSMLLPIADADAYCGKKLIFSDKIAIQNNLNF